MNTSTIIFWHPEHWELAVSVSSFFDKLRNSAVFNDSPKSAALMVNQVWDDVDKWWQSDDIGFACNEFRLWFCRKSQEPIRELFNLCC